MTDHLIIMMGNMGVSLGLTLLLEWLAAVCLGIRTRKDLLLVGMVNILTNPGVVYCYYLIAYYTTWNRGVAKAALECAAIAVEAYIYRLYGRDIRRPLAASMCMNCFSFTVGEIINIIL